MLLACHSRGTKPKEFHMSSTLVRGETVVESPKALTLDMKFEIVVIPVSDVDRAKRFYGGLGWRVDADFASGAGCRGMPFPTPRSGCSVAFSQTRPPAAAGRARVPCRT